MKDQPVQSKTVSSTEAQNNFGEISRWVAKENRIVYIQNNRTNEKLGLVSEKYLNKAEELFEKERRQKVWEQMEKIRLRVTDRIRTRLGRDLTEAEIAEIASK